MVDNLLHLTQRVRCYIEEPEAEDADDKRWHHWTAKRAPANKAEAELRDMLDLICKPYGGYCLVFDAETHTYLGMPFRVGYYQIRGIDPEARKIITMKLIAKTRVRGLPLTQPHPDDLAEAREAFDVLQEDGFYYNPATLDGADVAFLHEYAAAIGAKVWLWHDWLRDVFMGTGDYWNRWKYDELIIGHNLPFDISTSATAETFGRKENYGGWVYRVCGCRRELGQRVQCPLHPYVGVKQTAVGKAFMRFRPARRQKEGERKSSNWNIAHRHLLDTRMLARALKGPGAMKLSKLTEGFDEEHRKRKPVDYDGPINQDYLDYLVTDVKATWRLYQELRELYCLHGTSRAIWRIYSEASLGDGYLSDMGVPYFLERHPIPKPILARWMETFYGGRAETMDRLSPRDIIHCDFLSQYPTVNRLMRLQELLIAEKIDVCWHREGDPEFSNVVGRLEAADLDTLANPDNWPLLLRGIALVEPAGDILPVRGPYGEGSYHIALPIINGSPTGPAYWTFLDIIASKLRTGKLPKILETIELIPRGRIATKIKVIFNKKEYIIDLEHDDLFQAIIDLRKEIQKEIKGIDAELANQIKAISDELKSAKGECRTFLNQLQLALKLLANATSYGKLVEFIVTEMDTERECFAYIRDEVRTLKGVRTEHPGRRFAPLGSLIPAAGRLLLMIAEVLAEREGLRHVFCDTDSMCFAKPEGVSWDGFEARANRVVKWFEPLHPYRDKAEPLFKIEHGAKERLRCLAVSAKRYGFYRLGDPAKGEPRTVIEKISAHGLSPFRDPAGYVSRYPDAPLPDKRKHKSEPKRILDIVPNCACPYLAYDIWREAIEAVEGALAAGASPEQAAKSIPMERPWLRYHKYIDVAHVGTSHVAKLYDGLPGLRSFEFFSTIPHLMPKGGTGFLYEPRNERERDLLTRNFYAPKADRVEDVTEKLLFADTGEPVNLTKADLLNLEFQTLEYRLRGYFYHEEATAWPPRGVGQLERRHVIITDRHYIGKESNIEDEDPDVLEDDRLHKEFIVVGDAKGELHPLFDGISLKELARRSGIDRNTLRKYRSNAVAIPPKICRMLRTVIAEMREEQAWEPPKAKPPKMKNMRNLTAGGKVSSKGDTLRLEIERLGRGDYRTPLSRLAAMVEGIISHSALYHWYKQHSKLSPEQEAALKTAVAKGKVEDVERVKQEAAEEEELNRRLEERRKARMAKRRKPGELQEISEEEATAYRSKWQKPASSATDYADPEDEGELEELTGDELEKAQEQLNQWQTDKSAAFLEQMKQQLQGSR